MNSQLDFYRRSPKKRRTDGDFDWAWLDSLQGVRHKLKLLATPLINAVRPGYLLVPYSQQWFDNNSRSLWESRELLADEISRQLFDKHLLLISSGYQRYFFPRTEWQELVEIRGERAFSSSLPGDFLGLPLKIFTVGLNRSPRLPELQLELLATRCQLELLNRYRQYFLRREQFDLSPRPGETVFDCGACIGEMSVLFAALVGGEGAVHLFDPVPLHIRYCQFQAELNPSLSPLFHINTLAVGENSANRRGTVQDAAAISPGGCQVDSFQTISLDHYRDQKNLRRVDFIKMDVEGAELAALQGACGILAELKPRLAISAYHKQDDLWTIPRAIKKLNPDYRLYFGHHSPMQWESMYYAA